MFHAFLLLQWSTGLPTVQQGQQIDDKYRLYTSIVPEFQVERYDMPSHSTYDVPIRKAASILLILQGTGRLRGESAELSIQQGKVFFVSANEAIRFDCDSTPIQAYRACPREEWYYWNFITNIGRSNIKAPRSRESILLYISDPYIEQAYRALNAKNPIQMYGSI